MLLLVLFLLWPKQVIAEKIETPYFYIDTVEKDYIPKENEKIIEKDSYLLKEKTKETANYYFENTKIKGYRKDEDKYIYTKWSSWQNKKLNNLEEEQKITYFYQPLKKIDRIIINEIKNITIMKIEIKLRKNNQVMLTWHNTPLSMESNIILLLDKFYSPEDLKIETSVFLWQEKNIGSFQITDITQKYIKEKSTITKKGISIQKHLLINCLVKMQWETTIEKTSSLEGLTYYKLIKEETKYRYRTKLYKYQKIPKEKISKELKLKDYELKEIKKDYERYRKEIIKLYDEIILKDYIDVEKVIKETTLPLKLISFSLRQKDNRNILKIKYKSFIYEKEISMEKTKVPKSRHIIGSDPSFIRKIISYLLKMSIIKKF